jgi:hypothetical protein
VLSPQQANATQTTNFNVFSLLSDTQTITSAEEDISVTQGLEAEWTSYCYATNLPDKRVDILRWWQVRDTQLLHSTY